MARSTTLGTDSKSLEHTTLSVEGMTCASCQVHVEHALRDVPGVSQASVNLMMHSAEVT
jgi:Cu+-exporting ATPase